MSRETAKAAKMQALAKKLENYGLNIALEIRVLFDEIKDLPDFTKTDKKEKVSAKLEFFTRILPYVAPKYKDADPLLIINNNSGPTQINAATYTPAQLELMERAAQIASGKAELLPVPETVDANFHEGEPNE